MKTNKQQRRKEFYVHQIVREGENEASQTRQVVNMRNTRNEELDRFAQSVDCNLDLRRYDNLRRTQERNHSYYTKGNMINNEPQVNNTPYQNNNVRTTYQKPAEPVQRVQESEDNYYNNLADSYVQTEEVDTTIDDVMSETEFDQTMQRQEEPVQPMKEPLPEPVSYPRMEPVVSKPKPVKPMQEDVTIVKRKKLKYFAPGLELLNKPVGESNEDVQIAEENKEKINKVLKESGIGAHVAKYIFGPTVVQYLIEFESLTEDVKSLRRVENNLAMYLACTNIRMQTPIPGMSYAGIEIPRDPENRGTVYLSELLADKAFTKSKMILPIAVGKNNFGKNIYVDITDMPHALCAGASKSGKSVALNAFILSLIYHYTPSDVRLVLVDPKTVEFGGYQDIPHLCMPVILEEELLEPALQWLVDEMDRRYKILNKYGCKELSELNEQLLDEHQDKIPFIVMIMDEFNEWFANASESVETNVTRLGQKARAAGINIILATQRPDKEVIKGSIKANFPTRFAFKVSSAADSIVILGQACAEKLEGRGDMILRHSGMDDTRLQGCFVSNKEVKAVTKFLRENNTVDYYVTEEELKQSSVQRGPANGVGDPHVGRNDELFEEVVLYVVRNKNASVNAMQRIFGTGFNRMDAIFRDMEALGIINKAVQGGRREVLMSELDVEKILENL